MANDANTVRIAHAPTSELFQAVLKNAPADRVTAAWLLASLGRRSFGMVMLLLGLLAMVPGVSPIAGILLAGLAFQMMMAREVMIVPRAIASRALSTRRIARLIARAIPVMKALETFIRPRWPTPFIATKRIVGLIVLILAASLLMPIPLSNIIPGATIMLVAFAYLEEDGVLLCVALSASLASLAITAVEVWAAVKGADFLIRL
jgi:hypothetical protein